MEQGTTLKRRGILAAAGAVVAGIVAKQASVPVAAAAPMLIADTATPVTNTVAGETRMSGVLPAGAHLLVVTAQQSQLAGDLGAGGILGRGVVDGCGVVGLTNDVEIPPDGFRSDAGVYAQGGANSFSAMVAVSYATLGQALHAVNLGDGFGAWIEGRVGVWARAYSPNNDPNSAGMVGEGGYTVGILGRSGGNHGVVGTTTAGGYAGVTGVTGSPQVAAIAGVATVPTAYAAYFTGTTIVQGDFVAFGGAKSAAVKDASGQHRLVYCVESPEAWFEDFGEATLVSGKATVALDKTFTEIARTDRYQVFLTDYGSSGHLSVASRTTSAFTVQADKAGAGGTVGWRVVAKRADIKGERLAKFAPPKINFPDPSKLPKFEPPKPSPSPLPPKKP